ncbi:DegV family protein [Acidaminobacter sp. JC074]|uniref:DegV family protein n=1 Tax=Acidaminobacter sp. JC074 TaxID=2530199 RepID=UPI001F0FC803|nr:DegV family protein [Acidaminobacter sp. JC074]MCH4888559.1 DegV family protein [Acidaminobacter sp. JC074]
MKIAVIADSTAVMGNVTHDHLYSVPLKIIFEHESYEDGIDLTQETFFNLLKTKTELPTTSQPSIGEVEKMFTDLLEIYDHIIYLTISSGISGTFDSGMMARNLVDENRITVFDTLGTSIIQKLMTLDTLKFIDEGKSVEEIVSHLEAYRNKAEIYLVVDDLKHLSRTGRVSTTSAQIGSMLKIKPILQFADGKIELFKKVRSAKKAHQALIDLAKEANLSDDDLLMIAHADGIEYAEAVKSEILKIYPNLNIGIDPLSPVISVHTGPKTIGVGWIRT